MNILPKIEALAVEQGINRSDIIKDILYAKFDYEPNVRPQNQIKKDYIAEKNEENESGYRYIAVRIDNAYRDMFYFNIIRYPGRLDRNCNIFFNQALYEYFGLEFPICYSAIIFDKPIIRPDYQRIRISGLAVIIISLMKLIYVFLEAIVESLCSPVTRFILLFAIKSKTDFSPN